MHYGSDRPATSFYLFYEEGYNLAEDDGADVEFPRECYVLKHLEIPSGGVIVEVNPPFRYDGADLNKVLLVPRHYGVSIWPQPKPGAAVHIGRIHADTIVDGDKLDTCRDVEIIAWGSLVANREEAERARKQSNTES